MSSVQIDQKSYEMPPRDSYRQQRCWHFGQETLHGQQKYDHRSADRQGCQRRSWKVLNGCKSVVNECPSCEVNAKYFRDLLYYQ